MSPHPTHPLPMRSIMSCAAARTLGVFPIPHLPLGSKPLEAQHARSEPLASSTSLSMQSASHFVKLRTRHVGAMLPGLLHNASHKVIHSLLVRVLPSTFLADHVTRANPVCWAQTFGGASCRQQWKHCTSTKLPRQSAASHLCPRRPTVGKTLCSGSQLGGAELRMISLATDVPSSRVAPEAVGSAGYCPRQLGCCVPTYPDTHLDLKSFSNFDVRYRLNPSCVWRPLLQPFQPAVGNARLPRTVSLKERTRYRCLNCMRSHNSAAHRARRNTTVVQVRC